MPVKVKLNGRVLHQAASQAEAVVFAFENNLTYRARQEKGNRRFNLDREKQCVQYVPGVEFEETLNEDPN